MTRRGVARAAFPSLRCPYCHSANVAADGEYVCRDCGTVIGPVFMPPVLKEAPRPTPRYRLIMAALEREGRRSVRRRYSEIVEMYLNKVSKALGAEVAVTALEMFRRLDKRVYQSRSPRVVAATLTYLAAERLGIYVHKQTIAEILKVSKFTIKDTAWRLRRHLQEA
ncbi:Transcription initiation factor TFIIIB, Brf1 subunit/Transcription initiation factor TFIIB [Pyrobaculum oguniense TE7]|uniref:Transcription initiation factor TFIIIB, Brf1 subunit/Transcription initiation factor TFIIB n=1 Tax=Pyrobaculum oguniense (strain DSM 13380 / JCM 10595 / TE7) TaxID=698757 RepID=H6Q7V6_PYROT|nr:Transcription initiation factor TFIIIB, Brf1 subunit/Transcription initiation factor TFIIB [Pyrobaculum oguniense TE7]